MREKEEAERERIEKNKGEFFRAKCSNDDICPFMCLSGQRNCRKEIIEREREREIERERKRDRDRTREKERKKEREREKERKREIREINRNITEILKMKEIENETEREKYNNLEKVDLLSRGWVEGNLRNERD